MRLFSRLRTNSGFTIAEVLITLVIVFVVLTALAQLMTSLNSAWKTTATDAFAEAQDAFDTVARHLATATLAP